MYSDCNVFAFVHLNFWLIDSVHMLWSPDPVCVSVQTAESMCLRAESATGAWRCAVRIFHYRGTGVVAASRKRRNHCLSCVSFPRRPRVRRSGEWEEKGLRGHNTSSGSLDRPRVASARPNWDFTARINNVIDAANAAAARHQRRIYRRRHNRQLTLAVTFSFQITLMTS